MNINEFFKHFANCNAKVQSLLYLLNQQHNEMERFYHTDDSTEGQLTN